MGLKELLSNKLAVAAILVAAVLVALIVLMQPAAKAPVPMCGDSVCSSDESCAACPGDCGVCGPSCGDSVCDAGENCSSCPADCTCGQPKVVELINRLLPAAVCNFPDDGGAYLYATNASDIAACSCITDENMRVNCKSTVIDSSIYQRAIDVADLGLCGNISNPEMKKSCEYVVNSKIAFIQSQGDKMTLPYMILASGDYESAIAELAGTSDFDLLLILSTAYSDAALFQHKQAEYVPKAIEAADKAIALRPDSAEAYRAKGFAYEVQPDLLKAVEVYDLAISKDPGYAPSYMSRGHAKNKMGAIPDAIADFEKAKSLDPGNKYPDIRVQLCRLYSAGDIAMLEKSIGNCNEALEKPSIDADLAMGAHVILGDIYMRAGRFNESLDEMRLALTYKPDSADALTGLSRAYIMLGDYAEAQSAAEKSLSIDPKRAMAHWALSYSLYRQSRFDEAIPVALEGISLIEDDVSLLPPNKPQVERYLYYTLANIYHEKGDAQNENKYKELAENA